MVKHYLVLLFAIFSMSTRVMANSQVLSPYDSGVTFNSDAFAGIEELYRYLQMVQGNRGNQMNIGGFPSDAVTEFTNLNYANQIPLWQDSTYLGNGRWGGANFNDVPLPLLPAVK